MPWKNAKKFNWVDKQDDFIRKLIADGKMLVNTPKDQYKAAYEASEGEVLKCQGFYESWMNVQHSLCCSNDVLQSMGIRGQNAIAAAAAAAPATSLGLAVEGPPLTTPRSTNTCISHSWIHNIPKNGMLKASGDLYWPTMHSYWNEKDKNKQLQLFVILPYGCHPEDLSVSFLSSEIAICIVYKWPECMFQPECLFEGQMDMHGTVT